MSRWSNYSNHKQTSTTEHTTASNDPITDILSSVIEKLLKDAGFRTLRTHKLMPIIVSALEYIEMISSSTGNNNESTISEIMEMIRDIALDNGVTIDDNELLCIEDVVRLANDFYVAYVANRELMR
jgi:hypothetical protein